MKQFGIPLFLLMIFSIWVGNPAVLAQALKSKNILTVNGNDNEYVFYLGTYTNNGSKGIYRFVLHKDGTLTNQGVAAQTENPSFLAFSPHHKVLLAVNENDTGTVESFAVTADTTLRRLSHRPSGGSYPCHVSVSSAGDVLISNYGSGTVGLLHLDGNGQLSPLLYVEHHTLDHQTAHAHESVVLPGSRQVVSVDLGTNRLWFSKLDASGKKLLPSSPRTLLLPPGSGPRHFVLNSSRNRMYVANESGNTVSVVRKNKKGVWVLGNTFSTLPAHFKGKSYCGEIQLSPNGRFLYVSNRGFNTIALFAVDSSGNKITLLDNFPVHGNYPRFFILTPDGHYLLVANQKSDNLVVFKRDNRTGTLDYVGETNVPAPVCIAFF